MATDEQDALTAPPIVKARPHPRLDSAKRTWFFFRRNTLALVGLAVIVSLGATAAYAATTSLDWYNLPTYCSASYGPTLLGNGSTGGLEGWPGNYTNTLHCSVICTYEVTPPPNAASTCQGHWYKIPFYAGHFPNGTPLYISYASEIGPTVSLSPLSMGPMPLGSLTVNSGGSSSIFNIGPALLRGSDWSLIFALSIVGIGAMVGLLVGAIAGYFGGMLDEVLMRLVDIFLSIPQILFVIVVVAVVTTVFTSVAGLGTDQTKLLMIIVGFSIVWWPFYARLVRGQVLVVREQKYVEAARASGASKGRILLRHIIPNSVYPIFVQFSLDVGTIPLLIGALVYLGFGVVLFPRPNFPEWGSVSALSVQNITDVLRTCEITPPGCVIPWWQLVFPGFILFLFAISVNLLSDGLRDAFDPRLRR